MLRLAQHKFWILDCGRIITDGKAMDDLRFTRQGELVLFRWAFVHAFAPPRRGTSGLFLRSPLNADYGTERAQRKPISKETPSGSNLVKLTTSASHLKVFQEPPRNKRLPSEEG
jgi:hypothetical protein